MIVAATFLEGLLSFVNPCVLPMLPVYLIYLAGDVSTLEAKQALRQRMINTCGFVLGFTLLFVAMGATATALGVFLRQYQRIIERIAGALLILFGLQMAIQFRIPLLHREKRVQANTKNLHFFSSMVFGAAFSLGWLPCSGPLLGSALLKAGTLSNVWEGMALLFVYAMGLGLPFLLLSVFYEKCQPLLNFFKKHIRAVQIFAGVLLIAIGLAMVTGLYMYYASWFRW